MICTSCLSKYNIIINYFFQSMLNSPFKQCSKSIRPFLKFLAITAVTSLCTKYCIITVQGKYIFQYVYSCSQKKKKKNPSQSTIIYVPLLVLRICPRYSLANMSDRRDVRTSSINKRCTDNWHGHLARARSRVMCTRVTRRRPHQVVFENRLRYDDDDDDAEAACTGPAAPSPSRFVRRRRGRVREGDARDTSTRSRRVARVTDTSMTR